MSSLGVGKLVLKGGLDLSRSKSKKHKKHKRKKSKKHSNDKDGEGSSNDNREDPVEVAPPVRMSGTGQILTSGTTVFGQNTEFMKELSVGDALMVTHPTSLVDEIRLCTMVLSNISVSLSSPFSSDLVTGTSFSYIKKPKSKEDEAEKVALGEKRKRDSELGPSNVLTYREKASGGYRIVTKQLDKEMTREELLDMRCKKKSDRICM